MAQRSVLLVCAAMLLPVVPARAGERVVARSDHYEISTSGTQAEADEWARMLEVAWPQFAAFFGAAPKLGRDERLRVALFDDADAWAAAIVAGGSAAPDSGGYYCPTARVAYLKRQPSAWYTRTLLLHEAAHQFHYLACTGNDGPAAKWYVEGVAEHLGSHTWDGETLRLGVTPLVSLEDRAGHAFAAVTRDGFGLADVIEAEEVPRPESMFLVRFLAETRPAAFRTLSRKLDRGARLDAAAFQRAFGKQAPFVAAWREWLAERREPLVSVFNEWDARGAGLLRGTSDFVGICRTRGVVRSFAATARRAGARGLRAGVVLSFTSKTEYVIAFVDERGGAARLEVDRRSDGRWHELGWTDLGPHSPEGWQIEAVRGEGGVTVAATRDGAEGPAGRLGPFAVPEAPMGLAIDACEAEFLDPRTE